MPLGGDSAWSPSLRAELAARTAIVPRRRRTPPRRPGPRDQRARRGARRRAPSAPAPSTLAPSSPGFFARLRLLGQLDHTYLVCEGDGELVLIDQHVAHERVILHGLRTRGDHGPAATQRLLFPAPLTLAAAHRALVARVGDTLRRAGFELGADGGSLVAVPAGLRADPEAVLTALLGELDAAGGDAPLLDRALATVACHTAIRAGDTLGPDEARALLRSMDEVDFDEPGLHGRPVLLRLDVAELGRRFGR
ncbi:MAG: hypothetical protein R2939_14245 [Kofleriaceae bacterium]